MFLTVLVEISDYHIVKYLNSENEFDSSEKFKNNIQAEIKYSGITARTSKKFWEHIRTNYDDAYNVLGKIDDLSNELSDVNGHVNALIISSLAIYNIALMFALGIAAYQIKYHKRTGSKIEYCIFISFLILIAPIIPIAISAGIKNSKFSEYLDSIKSEDSQFIANIKNDKKYFYNSGNTEGYKEFDKLTLDEKRKLKTYYSTYKNKETVEDKKTQSQKDYEQLLGFNENKDNLYSYLDDFTTWLWILADIWGILVIFAEIIAYAMFINITNNVEPVKVSFLKTTMIVASIVSVGTILITIAATL